MTPDEITSAGEPKLIKHMKSILLLVGVVALFMSTGCFFVGHREGGYYEHGHRRHMEYHPVYAEPSVDVHIHN